MSAAATTLTTKPACPEWCVLPAGHGYDLGHDPATDWECVRFHVSGGHAALVEVSQVENVPHGVAELGPVELRMYDDVSGTITPAEAVAMAAQIPAAVGLYERLTAAER